MNNRVKLEPLAFLKWVVMSLIAVLIWQTFSIQVLNSEVYQTKTKDRVTSMRNIYADRGRIMDRNGIVFADNLRDSTKGGDYSRIFLQGHLASHPVFAVCDVHQDLRAFAGLYVLVGYVKGIWVVPDVRKVL